MITGSLPVSRMAHGLVGSEILKIAAEIRAKVAGGAPIINLTVGDYRPDLFPIPGELKAAVLEAYDRAETNYPPSDGVPELRRAVQRFYRERLNLDYPIESIVIASGVRPAIYCTFRTFVDPDDAVIYPVPSWNNNHYIWLSGGRGIPVMAGPEANFLPTADQLRPHLAGARLMVLCSPLNPAGTAYDRPALAAIVELLLEENARRDDAGIAPLILMYDQVYWMLTFGGKAHVTPVEIDGRMREYTVFTDGISKGLAATGLRVGWAVGPPAYMKPFSDILGHVGAWAPRPEQVATARFLSETAAIDRFVAELRDGVETRLTALHTGFEAMRADGYPVFSIPPAGAIYLSTRLDLIGRTVQGRRLDTNEEIRRFLLEAAGLAVVPFQAFGLREESGWFRLSVGALPLADVPRVFPALRQALNQVDR